MRYRNRGTLVPKSASYQLIDHTCSSGTTTGTVTCPYEMNGIEFMSDVVTPRFNRRSSAGEVIFNPMTHSKMSSFSSGGMGWRIKKTAPSCSSPQKYAYTDTNGDSYPAYLALTRGGTYDGLSVILPSSILTSSDVQNACTEASTEALAQVDSGDSNFVESLAEFKQTLNLAGSSLESANKILSRIPKRVLNGASSAYLLYRFGLKPLISDIDSAIKHMATITERKRRTFRSNITISRNNVSTVSTNLGGSSLVSHQIIDTDVLSVRAMTLVEYVVSRERELGLTAKNLLTVPWELLPYSFVVDYYVNVGSFFKALAPTPGVNTLGSCLVQERTITTRAYPTSTTFVGSGWTVERPVSGGYTSVSYTKSRGAISSPGIAIKADFRLDSLPRVLNQVALIVQRLTSRRN